jgi:SAM-dependent methyltransferase
MSSGTRMQVLSSKEEKPRSLLRSLNVARVQTQIRLRNQFDHPKGLEVEEVACPLCGNDHDFETWYRPYLLSPLKIVGCARCRLAFLRPMPTGAFYERYYSTGYFQGVARSRAALEQDERQRRKFVSFEKRAREIFAMLSPTLEGKRPVMLEVGAAHGLNLGAFSALPGGAELYEDELDRRWAPLLADAGIVNWHRRRAGLLADVLILSHVVEHFRDPVVALRASVEQVKPGGLVYIEVPNVRTGRQPSYPYKLAHTMYFTPATLRLVAEKAGLENVRLDESDVIRSFWRRR